MGSRDPLVVSEKMKIKLPPHASQVSASAGGFPSHVYSLDFNLPHAEVAKFLSDIGAQVAESSPESGSPYLRRLKRDNNTRVLNWERSTGERTVLRGVVLVDEGTDGSALVRIRAGD